MSTFEKVFGIIQLQSINTLNKIRTILIDDEDACTETLAIELGLYCPEIEVVAKCNTAKKAITCIRSLNPDLIFLDIQMPWMNGFELLEQFDIIDFDVVFITAYDTFALKAFRVSAVDYLLKPIDKDDLIEAVGKVMNRRSKTQISSQHLALLLENIKQSNTPLTKVALPTMSGLDFVAVKDIIYCESDNNYCKLHLVNRKTLMLSKPLKEVEQMLSDHQVFRIHQSFLINLEHISKYIRGNGGYVIMSNGDNVTVARSKKELLLKLVKGFNK